MNQNLKQLKVAGGNNDVFNTNQTLSVDEFSLIALECHKETGFN